MPTEPSSPPPTAPSAPPPVVRDEALTARLQRRRSARRRTGAVLGATAIGAVLLLSAVGILPLFPRGTGAPAISFQRALDLARASVPVYLSGATTALTAVGIDDRSATSLSATAVTNGSTANCTATDLSGVGGAGAVGVPAFAGAFADGLAPFWLVVLQSSGGAPFVLVVVVNGAASAALELSGAGCTTGSSGLRPLPSTFADSPAPARSVWNASAQAYVGANAAATVLTMTPFGGASSGLFTAPAWLFVYAPCTPVAGGATSVGAEVAGADLVTGAFDFSLTTTLNCPP